MKTILLATIYLYRLALSPLLGRRCRFTPSCSQYVQTCLEQLPLHRALFFGILRLIKCHPFHPGGYDPPPKRPLASPHTPGNSSRLKRPGKK